MESYILYYNIFDIARDTNSAKACESICSVIEGEGCVPQYLQIFSFSLKLVILISVTDHHSEIEFKN